MSPSRGRPVEASNPELESSNSDRKADLRSSSALALAKQNISFLYSPSSAAAAPARLRTRAVLRALHYIGVFIFWRIVRYARYAVVGAVVAATVGGSTALGSGVAFVVAPPTLLAGVGVGLVWALGRWAFARVRGTERAADSVVRSRRATVVDGSWRSDLGPSVVPW